MNRISRIVVLLIILFVAKAGWGKVFSGEVGLGSHYESNVFYLDETDHGDLVMSVKPKVKVHTKPAMFRLKVDFLGEYLKYLNFPEMDTMLYQGQLGVTINEHRQLELNIYGGGELKADPALYKEQERILHQEINGGGELKWRASDISTFFINGTYKMDTFADEERKYLNNYEVYSEVGYDYKFLPETSIYWAAGYGLQTYPEGFYYGKTSPNRKSDSSILAFMGGIRGRLSDKTKLDTKGGLLFRTYAKDSSFAEPVFNLRFEEQVTPRDHLSVGYNYEVEDSYFTNYMLIQEMFLGYGRILGDQVLLLTRLSYAYLSYSKPIRREDQKIITLFHLEYSINPNLRMITFVESEVLSSDSYNTELGTIRDPSVNYEYVKTGVSFSYLF
jgi:hypothetical protein